MPVIEADKGDWQDDLKYPEKSLSQCHFIHHIYHMVLNHGPCMSWSVYYNIACLTAPTCLVMQQQILLTLIWDRVLR